MKTKANVHLLPTDKASEGVISKGLRDILYPQIDPTNPLLENYHIYITDDSEIREGDWYIDDCNEIRQSVTSDKDYWDRRPDYKKIIASTDTSLGITPIHQDFIELFIKAHNNSELTSVNGVITMEVMVEYENNRLDSNSSIVPFPELMNELADYADVPRLRLKLKDDYIVISPIKDRWTREEVERLCENAYDSGRYSVIHKDIDNTFDKWRENNI